MASIELLQAVAVTAELCGRSFSEAAARVFVTDLAPYPEAAVIKALTRCRKEVRGALTVQDVVRRLDDGRPGPEEAWASMPMDEAQSVVWTDEMAQAYGVVCHMLDEPVQARMAFLETYRERVRQAREVGEPVKWSPSLGHDPLGRESALMDAAEKGRLTSTHAAALLPFSVSQDVAKRIESMGTQKQLGRAA